MLAEAALVVPKLTAVAPLKPLPTKLTLEPPAVRPLAGLIPVTTGAAGTT